MKTILIILALFCLSCLCTAQSLDTTTTNNTLWKSATLPTPSVESPNGWSIFNNSTVTIWVAFSVADTVAAVGGNARYSVIPAGLSFDKQTTAIKIYFKLAASGSANIIANKF